MSEIKLYLITLINALIEEVTSSVKKIRLNKLRNDDEILWFLFFLVGSFLLISDVAYCFSAFEVVPPEGTIHMQQHRSHIAGVINACAKSSDFFYKGKIDLMNGELYIFVNNTGYFREEEIMYVVAQVSSNPFHGHYMVVTEDFFYFYKHNNYLQHPVLKAFCNTDSIEI